MSLLEVVEEDIIEDEKQFLFALYRRIVQVTLRCLKGHFGNKEVLCI